MLHNLYIFHSTGKLLYSYDWMEEGSVKEDPVLVSGFLSAIWMFAQKIGSQGVRSIQTENSLLVGIASPKYSLLFVLVAKADASTAACKNLLGRIRQSFIQKYRKQLADEEALFYEDFHEWVANLENITEEMDVSPVESVMKRFLKDIVDGTTKEKPDK
ncbi:MAG TPA: hypothetical protein VMV49_01215 [Candidatus Deferrimicrobium sp.]|nr:hypothetical protein [Candidatus Deferrimicrobium sp.]